MSRHPALATVAALTCAASLLAAAGTTPASAGSGGTGSAHAQALYVNSTNQLTVPAPTSTGGLSTSGLSTLVSNLLQLPMSLTSALGSAVTSATGTQADSPRTSQTRPAAGSFPASCSTQGWNSTDCYNLNPAPAINVPGVANLSLGLLQGYATGDATGYVAGAGTATTDLTLLGGLLDLGNLGTITSLAQCSNGTSPTCSATQAMSGTSLLNGQVRAQVAQSGGSSVLTAQVLSNGSWVSVGSTTVPVGSTGTTVSLSSNLLTVKLALSVDQLFGLFNNGLTGLVAMTVSSLATSLAGLLGAVTGGVTLDSTKSAVTLTVKIGPGQTVSAGTYASAWGLDVNVGVAATIVFNDTGLLGKQIGTLTTTASGTLLDLELAYSSATAGSAVASWLPPGAI